NRIPIDIALDENGKPYLSYLFELSPIHFNPEKGIYEASIGLLPNENDLAVNDTLISHKHVEVRYTTNGFEVENISRKNSLWVSELTDLSERDPLDFTDNDLTDDQDYRNAYVKAKDRYFIGVGDFDPQNLDNRWK